MTSTQDYNTRSKEISDSKILNQILKLREELMKNLKKSFINILYLCMYNVYMQRYKH